nr:helix-turn-helix domain-containing protein [Escherichia coli]
MARLIKNGHDRKQLAIIYGIGTSTIYRYHPVGDIQTEETTGQTQENETANLTISGFVLNQNSPLTELAALLEMMSPYL